MNSLRTRLLASYTAIVVVCLLTLLVALLLFLRSSPVTRRLTQVRLNEAVRLAPPPPPANSAPETWTAYAHEAARLTGVRVMLIWEDGRLLADTASNPNQRLEVDPNVLRPSEPGAAEALTLRDARGREWLFVPRRLPSGIVVLFLQLSPRASALLFIRDNMLWPLAQAGVLALCFSFIFSVLIARSVAGPLRRMARAAQGIAQGRYDQNVPVAGPNEVRDVARAFNDMAQQVQASQQAQRDLVANVSHELKTPLTSIQGFAQAILDGAAESPEAVKRSASIIHDEAERMRRLVEGLLDLARLDAGQVALARGPVEMAGLLHSVAEKLDLRAAEKNVTLRRDIAPLPPMIGDADRLAQVFTNLLDNALKHTPPGGAVTLAAAPVAGGAEISVTDTGPGIPAEDLPRIFERFYQVDKSRKGGEGRGTGLGLAITREIVQAHGGQIRAESVVGLGTKFIVRLPAAQPGDTTVVRKR